MVILFVDHFLKTSILDKLLPRQKVREIFSFCQHCRRLGHVRLLPSLVYMGVRELVKLVVRVKTDQHPALLEGCSREVSKRYRFFLV